MNCSSGYVCSNCGQFAWHGVTHVCGTTRHFYLPYAETWPPIQDSPYKSARNIQLEDAYLKALIAYHETLLKELRRIDGTLEE